MDKKALYKLSYGMYIVSSRDGDKLNGQVANTVFQITSEPPTIAVSINKENLTHKFIEKSKTFGVTVLPEDVPLEFIGLFGFKSGKDIDKFRNLNYRFGKTGAPLVLDHAVAVLEAEVINSLDLGTHTLFIGKLVDAEIVSNREPMTYAYYHRIRGGKSPKKAPTYIEDLGEKKEAQKWMCKVCGYVYDPQKGDPESGIAPGTPFEELPDDWVCPVCGAPKDQFERS